jgi:hypothetical protein
MHNSKTLARESGAQVVLFDEKTEDWKSLDTVPLSKMVLEFYYHSKNPHSATSTH